MARLPLRHISSSSWQGAGVRRHRLEVERCQMNLLAMTIQFPFLPYPKNMAGMGIHFTRMTCTI